MNLRALLFGLLLCAGLSGAGAAQQGASFAEQAERGSKVYANACASCHGFAMEGGGGVALRGPDFINRWNGAKVGKLVDTVAKLMPMNDPGSLSPDENYAVVAYLLQRNAVDIGSAAIADTSAATTIAVASNEIDFTPAISSANQPPLPRLPQDARLSGTPTAPAHPTDAEIADPAPGDWLAYNRDYRGTRFSPLDQINRGNAKKLRPVCVYQFGLTGRYQTSPLIHDGVMYLTALNRTVALDATNCRKKWEHNYVTNEPTLIVVNRGVALYRGVVYRGTPSGHLIALDAANGTLLWDAWVSSTRKGYFLSAAPVAFDGKVFIGEAGADFGAPGHVHAFDAATGRHLWSFDLVAQKGQRGGDSWPDEGVRGGGGTWSSYAIDPERKRIYAPSANPAPDWDGSVRPGANLFTNAMVALDTDSGKLDWYAQQAPGDTHDWDTAAAPGLFEMDGRRYATQGSKDGWLYIYDRDRKTLVRRVRTTTLSNNEIPVTTTPVHACPGTFGGVEWNGAAFSPTDRALFVNAVDWCGVYQSETQAYTEGALYLGGSFKFDPVAQARGWVRSFDAASGKELWAYNAPTPMLAGVTPTAGGVLFTGDLNGEFLVFDSRTGDILYRFSTGGAIAAGISSYAVGGRQYVAVPSGNTSRTMWQTTGAASLFIFALDE